MSSSTLIRMMVERDGKGNPVLTLCGEPIPTWVAPAVVPFFKAPPPTCPEQTLWREVAARCVLDALGFSSVGNKSAVARKASVVEAREYLRLDNEQAKVIFYAAGVEFDTVVNEVIKLIKDRGMSTDDTTSEVA